MAKELSIVSYNLNGIRAAQKKNLFDWMLELDADIYCVQETKARPEQVDISQLTDTGYHDHWYSAEKKGYSGVAIFSKQKPDFVEVGCGEDWIDTEGRIIRADFGDLTLLNCYFPSGTSGEERQAMKYKYLDFFFEWAHELRKSRPNMIIVGDYNIAHTEIDIHNPKSKNSGFLPDEREWMTKWFDSGFHDAFRLINPDMIQYSWWSYRFNSRAKNKGWRIDYQSVSDSLKDKVTLCHQINEAVHSDHCPVHLKLKL